MAEIDITRLGWTLVHFLWQGALVAGLFAIVGRLIRERSSEAKYAFASATLVVLALLPVGTYLVLAPAPQPVAKVAVSTVRSVAVQKPVVIQQARALPPSLAEWVEANLPVAVGLWALGVAVLGLRMLGGLWLVERLKRRLSWPVAEAWQSKVNELAARAGIGRIVQLRESAHVLAPAAMGVFRSTIIVPASLLARLPAEQIEAVILHELAHIRRHDYVVNLVQSVVETVLFYHPAVWYVSQTVRAERENCCDDFAVRALGNPILYARALTNLETERRLSPLPVLSATGGPFMNRISRIVGIRTSSAAVSPLWAAAAAVAMTTVVVGGTLRANAQAPASKAKPAAKDKKPKQAAKKSIAPVAKLASLPPPVQAGVIELPPIASAPVAKPADLRLALPPVSSQALPPPVPAGVIELPSIASVPRTGLAKVVVPPRPPVGPTRGSADSLFEQPIRIGGLGGPPVTSEDVLNVVADNGLVSITVHRGDFALAMVRVGKAGKRSVVVERGNYQPVNISLSNVPFEGALDALCRAGDATWVREGEIYYISWKNSVDAAELPAEVFTTGAPPAVAEAVKRDEADLALVVPADLRGSVASLPKARFTLTLKNSSIQVAVGQVLAHSPGLRAVVVGNGYPKLTTTMKDASLSRALNWICQVSKATWRLSGNTVYVTRSK